MKFRSLESNKEHAGLGVPAKPMTRRSKVPFQSNCVPAGSGTNRQQVYFIEAMQTMVAMLAVISGMLEKSLPDIVINHAASTRTGAAARKTQFTRVEKAAEQDRRMRGKRREGQRSLTTAGFSLEFALDD